MYKKRSRDRVDASQIVIISKSSGGQFARDKANMASRTTPDHRHRRIRTVLTLVRAGGLDVAGLLAAVANALGGGLLGAVSGKMADLATYVLLATAKDFRSTKYLQL